LISCEYAEFVEIAITPTHIIIIIIFNIILTFDYGILNLLLFSTFFLRIPDNLHLEKLIC
jgi:hypothetical protein